MCLGGSSQKFSSLSTHLSIDMENRNGLFVLVDSYGVEGRGNQRIRGSLADGWPLGRGERVVWTSEATLPVCLGCVISLDA